MSRGTYLLVTLGCFRNEVDSDVLREAQSDPDSYRDLVVRISGYSAIFVNLSDLAQEEIINRIMYEAG